MSGSQEPQGDSEHDICTKLHALYCFDVLAAHFEKREPVPPPFDNAEES